MNQSTKRLISVLGRRLRPWLLIFAALYLVVCLGCAFLQRRLIYFPPVYTTGQADVLAGAARLERWKNPAGQSVGMKRMSPRQPAEGRVLIVYGNGGSAIGCAHYADVIQQAAPLDVFILEYPGYGDREGKPSQDNFFRAADEGMRLLGTNGPLYVAGESLGTGVACYLAGTYPNKVAGVVLLAPYNRLADVAQQHMPLLPVSLMLVDRFPSEDYLRQYHGPVAIFVGGNDDVVPEKFGRRLYDGYDGPKRIREIPGAGHGRVMARPVDDWKDVVDFWHGKSR